MPTKTPKSGAKTERLRIELDASASPGRVAVAAGMIDAAIKAIDPRAGESVTMVVSNFNLRSEARGLTGTGNRIIKKIGDVMEHPDRSLAKPKNQSLPDVADVLAKGFDELGEISASLYRGRSKTPFKRDSGKAIAGGLKDAAKRARKTLADVKKEPKPPEYPTGERRLRTSFYTRVMRFGRTAETSKDQVRIVLFGSPADVDVDPKLADKCVPLITKEDRVRVTIVGRVVDRDGSDEIDNIRVVDIDPTDVSMSSQDFIDAIASNADAFEGGLDGLRERIHELRGE